VWGDPHQEQSRSEHKILLGIDGEAAFRHATPNTMNIPKIINPPYVYQKENSLMKEALRPMKLREEQLIPRKNL
jgi:hypothetical protein